MNTLTPAQEQRWQAFQPVLAGLNMIQRDTLRLFLADEIARERHGIPDDNEPIT